MVEVVVVGAVVVVEEVVTGETVAARLMRSVSSEMEIASFRSDSDVRRMLSPSESL